MLNHSVELSHVFSCFIMQRNITKNKHVMQQAVQLQK